MCTNRVLVLVRLTGVFLNCNVWAALSQCFFNNICNIAAVFEVNVFELWAPSCNFNDTCIRNLIVVSEVDVSEIWTTSALCKCNNTFICNTVGVVAAIKMDGSKVWTPKCKFNENCVRNSTVIEGDGSKLWAPPCKFNATFLEISTCTCIGVEP